MFFSYSVTMVTTLWSKQLPYSGKFSLVQIFVEMRLHSPDEIFAVFIFVEQKHDALTTPLPDDRHTPYARVPKKWHWMTKWSKFVQQWLTLPFAITKVSRLHAGTGENLACWTEGFSTGDLKLDNFGAFFTGSLVFCTHSSRLSLFCSDQLQGRHYFCGRPTVVVPIHIT